MQRILFGFSFLTHPVFIPFYSIFIYLNLVLKYNQSALVLGLIWLLFVYLFLPTVYFLKVKKMELKSPNIIDRRSIFKVYSAINLLLWVVAFFMMKEYMDFFLGLAVVHLLMYLLSIIDLKASWHTAGWSYLLLSALVLWKRYQFVDFNYVTYILLGFLILVFICRLLQKAHNLFELVMGVAAGITASLVLIFL
jgi:hypothetical protein